ERSAHQAGARRNDLVRLERRADGDRIGRQDRRLPARSGAEIEPPLAHARRLEPRERERNQLGSLVLHAYGTSRTAHEAFRIPGRRTEADRREARRWWGGIREPRQRGHRDRG